ncbi:MAG: glutathione ABC transporter substrate-binding protein [Candidatus Bipolaricaulota bacterium]|nr:glutathione ABC transporter substrate-binding protein [Candidatus Bipolaricaulota bacterium]MDW8151393.1 glutathione ABC transporter substrate-binding protein [Candidatus Bipolaricaulota bacterium]
MKRIGLWVLCGLLGLSAMGLAQGPRMGGELIIAFGTDPESLDPNKITSAPAGMVLTHIAETLLTMTEDLEIAPLLAESWEFSEDSLALTLYLRKGVKFHDGTPFNAEAVKVNLERFRRASYRFLLYPRVQRIEVVDEYTVRLHLDMPFAPIISHLSHNFVAMVSPKQIAELPEGQDIVAPIGTGPFKFDKWVRGEYVRIVRNDEYWGPKPYVDAVVFRVVPSDATRLVLLETGQVHAIMRVPPLDAPRVAATPGLEVVKVPSVRTIYIAFNYQKAPWTDRRVRQALNYAVDKEAIVKEILGGAGGVSDAPIMPLIFGYSPQKPYEYDPEKAKKLLAEAGIPKGFKVTLYHPTGRYMMDAAIAEAVQAYLRNVGIEAELITMEWAAYLSFLFKPVHEATFDMFLLGWGTVTLDADYGLFSLFHTSQWAPAGQNRFFYSNPAVDALLEKARVTPDPEARKDLYAEAIKLIWQDAPWIFLHYEVQINAQSTKVKGLIHHPREYILAHRAWLE